ncbi:glycosyl transferase family 1 [Thermococcus sp. P6]|uniref:glycosyltransferase family 4 protein n=1 Tax=Thermococcus sp. P6 TaxID=122420 RepID=UPI000B59ECFA|nr:glycosyltransferase family 4 protein [Thermococcus sp. P6]ASJ10330.1 glycosyl transferase family 1 [Thermococcus sp. P6]
MKFKDKTLLILTNSYPDEDNTYYGGIFVKEQVEYLKDYFKEVYIISPQPYGGRRGLRDYEYDNVRAYYPRFFHLPVEYFRRRLGDNFFKAALKVINREGLTFDLVHAHFTWPSGYAGVKLGERFNVPVVITIHENRDWLLREYNSKNRKIHWTWENADALIRVNKRDITLLKEFNPNVFFVPNGFSPERLKTIKKESARESLGLPKDNKILFSLGVLIERKGFNYLIQAMSEVLKQRKDVLCFIGGSGPLKGKLQKQINELGLQNHVKLLGFVPDDELYLWMNSADVFVLPSSSEGNPTVMFEALGVGLPFVGTTVGGVPEIITSEDYGLLCPPRDSKCLAEKILIALEKDWDRGKIRKYAEKFTWENIVDQILKIYAKIIG